MSIHPDWIVIEQPLDAPIERVWAALTRPELMCQWFFEEIETFAPEVGFETVFTVTADGEDYVHRWNVLEASAPHRLVYRWRYDGHEGDSRVVWNLSEVTAGTRLDFVHEFQQTFPQDRYVFTREAGVIGWDYFLRQRLPEFLNR